MQVQNPFQEDADNPLNFYDTFSDASGVHAKRLIQRLRVGSEEVRAKAKSLRTAGQEVDLSRLLVVFPIDIKALVPISIPNGGMDMENPKFPFLVEFDRDRKPKYSNHIASFGVQFSLHDMRMLRDHYDFTRAPKIGETVRNALDWYQQLEGQSLRNTATVLLKAKSASSGLGF